MARARSTFWSTSFSGAAETADPVWSAHCPRLCRSIMFRMPSDSAQPSGSLK
jgi:hypothetical protein